MLFLVAFLVDRLRALRGLADNSFKECVFDIDRLALPFLVGVDGDPLVARRIPSLDGALGEGSCEGLELAFLLLSVDSGVSDHTTDLRVDPAAGSVAVLFIEALLSDDDDELELESDLSSLNIAGAVEIRRGASLAELSSSAASSSADPHCASSPDLCCGAS